MQFQATTETSRVQARLFQGVFVWFVLALLLITTPLYLNAQSDLSLRGDLNSTIKNALLSDPRSQSLSQEELDTLSITLTKNAQTQGMTAHDILWRPTLAHTVTVDEIAGPGSNCGNIPTFLCGVNRSLGLAGSDVTIMVLLGVFVAIILAVTAGYFELQHRNKMRLQAQV
ncbi:hypothetical protein HZC00_03250 [Candidatus Kaiserbacteria bacterium]|nr:hypothetical protein [Candidatus Kaiserbacteria bacterium]